jgi:FtsH-binding integral membrane protein
MMQNMESVSTADIDARVRFIRRTYAHLLGAVVAFVGLEFGLFAVGFDQMIAPLMMGSGFSWLIVLGLFMLVGHVANRWALSDTSVAMQYAGLGLYVVAESVLFLPLLFIAVNYSDATVIPYAGATTLVVFAALTVMVFATKKDFSFLRGGLTIAGVLAMVVIGAGLLFGFSLGLWFSVAMVGLSGGYILYYTSNVLHHYRTDQHVAASLALFSAVALLFWYVLRIFMGRD